jgi:Ni,Fe-hydrogenase III large subunit
MINGAVNVHNTEPVAVQDIPCLHFHDFQAAIAAALTDGMYLAALPVLYGAGCKKEIVAVLRHDQRGRLYLLRTEKPEEWSSMAVQFPQVAPFERELAEELGLRLQGHPRPVPLRYLSKPDMEEAKKARYIGSHSFLCAEGEEIHEVAVGPVHAGIIEPGHFRFLCHGETIFHLEISLGYQHRGIEDVLRKQPSDRCLLMLMETLAGDTSIGHGLTCCQAIEGLTGIEVSPRAMSIRSIALELERIANHVGDLGAMAMDVGYAPTASFCGRLRGAFLNVTAMICGNRYGRGVLTFGGTAQDLDQELAETMAERITSHFNDVTEATALLWNTPSVLARFEETGCLSRAQAEELGLVGPAARACALEMDARVDFPIGAYKRHRLPISVWFTGDVYGRAFVRWLEIKRSVAFILARLWDLPSAEKQQVRGALPSGQLVVSLVEGWRGVICHVVVTGDVDTISTYKVVDPSVHNWPGLAQAVRGEGIMDFPICNKSFDLSYCGHDL